jgi:hypothetical protein
LLKLTQDQVVKVIHPHHITLSSHSINAIGPKSAREQQCLQASIDACWGHGSKATLPNPVRREATS